MIVNNAQYQFDINSILNYYEINDNPKPLLLIY